MTPSGESPSADLGPPDENLPDRLADLVRRLRPIYDTRPVTRDEWDAAAGDEGGRWGDLFKSCHPGEGRDPSRRARDR